MSDIVSTENSNRSSTSSSSSRIDETTSSSTATNTNNNNNNNNNISKRICWVCFGSEQDDEQDTDSVWIYPCQCKGTMKWVHEDCLQRWIDEKQKRTNSCAVSCSQCKTHYILSYPGANRLVKLLEKYDNLLNTSCPIIAVSLVVGSVYWCCVSHGCVSIIQVMGYEEGLRFIDEADLLLLVTGLPVIPVTLILAKLIKWEDFILRVWRNNAFKLPRPLNYIIGEPPTKPRKNCDQILIDPGFNDPVGCTRMICGALLLPTISALVGRLFFSTVTTSDWKRSLFGGLAFLMVKGLAKVYLRKSRFTRYSQRSINNYVLPKYPFHSTTPASDIPFPGAQQSNRSGLQSGESANMDILPGMTADDDDNPLRGVVGRQDDDSDDDEGIPLPRALFSMTIRL